jgi:hypothetical protein
VISTILPSLTLGSATPLTGTDLILVAKDGITLKAGSSISAGASGQKSSALVVNGDGALLRVSGDASATSIRSGFTPESTSSLVIDPNAALKGTSIVLDLIRLSKHRSLRALGRLELFFEQRFGGYPARWGPGG